MNIEPNGRTNLIEEARTLLSAYIDNEVTETERQLVENALGSSADLKQELAALQQTVNLFQDLPRMKAPKPFTLTEADVSVASIQKKTKSGIWLAWGQWWKPAFGGSIALAAAILVGLFLFNQNSISEQSTPSMIAQAPVAAALEMASTIESTQNKAVEASVPISRTAPQAERDVMAMDEASSDTSDAVVGLDRADTQTQVASSETVPVDQPTISDYNEQAADVTGEVDPNSLNRDSFPLGQGGSVQAVEASTVPLATSLPPSPLEAMSGATTAKVTADGEGDLAADRSDPAVEQFSTPLRQEETSDSSGGVAPLILEEMENAELSGFVIERQLILVQRPTLAISGQIHDGAGNPLNNLHVLVRSANFCSVSAPSGPTSGLADGAYRIEFAQIAVPAEWRVSIVVDVEASPNLSCEDDLVILSKDFSLTVNEVAEIRLDWRKVE